MKLSGKMARRFILYFLSFYGILFTGTTILLFLFFYQIVNGFYMHDIKALEQYEIADAVRIDAQSAEFQESLIEIAERSGGILQLLDRNGKVVHSSKDDIFQTSYNLQQLSNLNVEKGIYSWFFEDGYTLIFREHTEADELLADVLKEKQFPILSEETAEHLLSQKASFELYDQTGKLQFSTSSNTAVLSPNDLLQTNAAVNERKELISYKTLENGNIAVVRMPNTNYQVFDTLNFHLLKQFIIGFFVYHVILLLFTLAFSLWTGNQFGKPIFFFLKWIDHLSKKDYVRPDDSKIRRMKDGRLKRKFRIFEDVDTSLSTLSANLLENEKTLKLTDKLREDWITGLSHDLKTPLSSIYGYAAMLESEHVWSQNEVKAFAATMTEKASYMDALIDDLTYTYQLKNDGVLLHKKPVRLHEYLQAYIQQCDWSNPISLLGDTTSKVSIDAARFDRVLDNIVGNAVRHNPAGTVTCFHLSDTPHFVKLTISDNGTGMDSDMLKNLFNRYYRGTNTTTEDSGTGLGMTIAKQLIEAHGGKVEAYSSNKGTAIYIHLPKADEFHT